jgi:hypothetical protein
MKIIIFKCEKCNQKDGGKPYTSSSIGICDSCKEEKLGREFIISVEALLEFLKNRVIAEGKKNE